MTTLPLQYQVLVVQQGSNYFARILELECEGMGRTADEAITSVSTKAVALLQQYDHSVRLPPPNSLSLASVKIQRPWTEARPQGTAA